MEEKMLEMQTNRAQVKTDRDKMVVTNNIEAELSIKTPIIRVQVEELRHNKIKIRESSIFKIKTLKQLFKVNSLVRG